MTRSHTTRPFRRNPAWVAAMGTFLGVLTILSLLSSIEWDASALLRVGENDPDIVTYVRDRLDHVRPVAPLGHDGKFYFIQAHDPFLLNPDEHAFLIDRPVYRTQRMLYPLLASVGGLLTGWAVVWGLIAVNLLAIGLGTWATARLAMRMGASPWLGLAFALNPGVVFELVIDGAGAVGWALAVLGILLLVEERYRSSVVALCAAVLAREAMILVAIGMALVMWRKDRVRAAGLVAWPAALGALWAVWVRWQLAVPLMTTESEELGLPLVGLSGALSQWLEEPGRNLLFGVVVVAFLAVVVWQAVRRPSLVSFSAIGFALLATLLTRQVWLNYFDITRAVAPVFTTFVLVLFARGEVAAARDTGGAGG